MSYDLQQRIAGNSFMEVMQNRSLIASTMPIEQRKVFIRAFTKILHQTPPTEVVELVTRLTLEQIIEHAASLLEPIPIASGERDGLKFQLFDPPAEPSS